MNTLQRIRELVALLNKYKESYYNKSCSEISDKEYDNLFDELSGLEKDTGFIMSNSPTQTVGYVVNSQLEKTKHKYPMLSLDKTKSPQRLIDFISDREGIMMFKADGLTMCVEYDENGNLVKAETRGDGIQGTLCTDNAKTFSNLPLHINHKGRLIVFGEAIVDKPTFDSINAELSGKEKFKTQRNMASGSLLQLDSSICAKRHLRFIAWRLVEGSNSNSFKERLSELQGYGFETILCIDFHKDIEQLMTDISDAKVVAEKMGFPIDGLVVGYDDVAYGDSLGNTSHHRRAELAFKYAEDSEDTELIDVEFTMGKTGALTPVLHFKPINLMDTTVERASAHNLSILKKLGIKQHSILTIVKKNDIIPQCISSSGGQGEIEIPKSCPICGGETDIAKDNDSEILICTNSNCKGKLLGKLTHAVSKNALNIEGLSESTLNKFIELGWLHSIQDIYKLPKHKEDMKKLTGFGEKSVGKLLDEIEKSKNITLDRFVYALSIPLIGKTASKAISKECNGSIEIFLNTLQCNPNNAFLNIDGFGIEMNLSLRQWVNENIDRILKFVEIFNFEEPPSSSSNILLNKIFCITGKLIEYSNRDLLIQDIEKYGGKVTSSVTAKTNYLINNDINSNSSKNQKAKQLSIPIITEFQFTQLLKKENI